MNDLGYITCAVLGCGERDIAFLDKELDNFDVDIYDIVRDINRDGETINFNAIIERIYETAIDNSNLNRSRHDINIFTNFSDSHLHIDGDEVYSAQDLDEIVERESEIEEDEL